MRRRRKDGVRATARDDIIYPVATDKAGASPGGGYDPMATLVAAQAAPRRVRSLPSLLRQGLVLAYTAGRGTLVLTAAGQLLGAVFAGLQVFAATFALRAVLDAERSGGSVTRAAVPLALLAALGALTTVTATLMTQRQRLLGELVTRHVWARVLRVTTSVPLESFESAEFYDRLQRVETFALVRPLTLAQSLVSLLGGLAGTLVLGVALLRIEPLLVPLLTLAGVPLILLNRRSSGLEFEFAVQQTPALRLRSYLRSVLIGRQEAKEVRAFELADPLAGQHDANYGGYVDALQRHLRRKTALLLVGAAATTLVTAGTLALLLLLVSRGRVSLAQAGGAVVAVRLLATRLQQVTSGVGQLFESGLFLAELDEFLSLEVPVRPSSARVRPFDALTARGLSFTYPGADRPAVADVDLDLCAGEVVAIVGENGSGKSTLAKLLAGLYTPTAGTVCWDDRDAALLDERARRAHTAVVFQDFVRYQLSARVNVGVGRYDLLHHEDRLRDAARSADVDELLSGLSAGYETVLSKAFAGGRELSGGQWQRIALARAFFRDAPFVVLDEPSAALDPRAEHELFSRLRTLFAGRSVLFISHRFSTVRGADRTYVMKGGRVVESGSHEELMAVGGLYAELFRLQAAAYQDDVAPASVARSTSATGT